MKNIVIVSGHPNLKSSIANKTILDEIAKNCPQVEIRKIDELYPDCNFDVKAEQAALENADVIVFQYPTYWCGVPGVLKLYIEKVMEHGWAYGSKGTALKGKIFIASTTTGVVANAYSHDGLMKHTIEEFSYWIENFAGGCQMECKKLFCIGGAMYVPGVTSDEQKRALIERVKNHAGDIIECLKSL